MSNQRIAVVGAAESAYGKLPDRSEMSLHAEAARKALDDAGLRFSDVDGLFTVTQEFVRSSTQTVAEYLGLRPTWEDATAVGGSSFEVMVAHAMSALRSGQVRVALITYGSTMLSSLGRTLGTRTRPISRFAQQYEEPYGMSIVAAYALAAQRHMHEYGTTPEQLAEIAVTTRRHASRNPQAMYQEPLTIDDVVGSREVASPLHKFDCCVISDGGGALVLTTEDVARDLDREPVWVLGAASATDHQIIVEMPDLTTTAAVHSGREAFGRAGITADDVDLLMTYDSFTITVLLALEDLGFCEKGEGGAFVEGGTLDLDGALPTNVDGGGLSSNHPGMRGIFLLIEAVRQLRGEGGDRQVADCEVAVAHGVGGWLSSHGTVVLGKDR